MCYNDYPLWPEHILYNFSNSGEEIKSISTTTTVATEDDSAYLLSAAIGLILVL